MDLRKHNQAVMTSFARRRQEMAALQVPDAREVTVLRDVEFARPDGVSLLLDLYLPAHAAEPCPVIVWLHGGGWSMGDRRMCPDLARYFAAEGYAMASIEYRLSAQAKFPAQLDDVRAALAWLREHASRHGMRADAIGLWGASAGAHLGILVALGAVGTPEAVQAVVDGYAPTDLREPDRGRLPGSYVHAAEDSSVARLLGGPLAELPQELLAAASPVVQVRVGAPPVLILHGDADVIVASAQSESLYRALAAAGAEVTLYLIGGVDHGFFGGRELEARPCPSVRVRHSSGGSPERLRDGPPATYELIRRFFDVHLRSDPWS